MEQRIVNKLRKIANQALPKISKPSVLQGLSIKSSVWVGMRSSQFKSVNQNVYRFLSASPSP